MRLGAAFLGVLLGLAPAAHAQSEAEQRARFERGRAEQRAFEHREFTEAGFPSIAEAQADGREVRRVLFRDPYGFTPMPGVELERLDDGRTTLRLQYRAWGFDAFNRAWRSEPVEVAPGAWEQLAALEPALFARPAFQPVRPGAPSTPPPPPPPVCHAWFAAFEADRERSASWTACGGTDHPGYRYAVRVAELAVRTRPGCKSVPGDALGSFSRCFALSGSLEDPALEAEYARLRQQYDDAPLSARLIEADEALKAPGLTLGSPAWLAARAAVGRYKEVHDLRQDTVERLVRLMHGAVDISDADRAKLRYTSENWSRYVRSQEPNYSVLLQRLAWPEGVPGAGP